MSDKSFCGVLTGCLQEAAGKGIVSLGQQMALVTRWEPQGSREASDCHEGPATCVCLLWGLSAAPPPCPCQVEVVLPMPRPPFLPCHSSVCFGHSPGPLGPNVLALIRGRNYSYSVSAVFYTPLSGAFKETLGKLTLHDESGVGLPVQRKEDRLRVHRP